MAELKSRPTSFWFLALLLPALAFVAGISLSPLLHHLNPHETEQASLEFTRLTNPFLEVAGELNGDVKLVRSRRHLLRFIRDAQRQDSTLVVSVYVRDLNNGPWIGIREKDLFVPASLNKVPVMIYILAQAESDPGLLERSVRFPGSEFMSSPESVDEALEGSQMEAGASYSYGDLLFRMIAFSDNHAKELLLENVSESEVEALMAVVHAGSTVVDGRFATDAKTYASIFRILYNSNFLSRSSSEYALELLTRSYFQGGIRRFIPEDVIIASKFGFNNEYEGRVHSAELHECGIIYQPGAPYVICAMTKSALSSVDQMAEVIAGLSRIVWTTKTE